MSTVDANKAAARAVFEVVDHGRLDELDAVVDPAYVLHDPSMPEEVRGVDGVKEMVEAYREAFGLRVTVEHQFADGDYVATRYTARGTHNAEFMGIPPTGREGAVSGICISRFRDGMIVEEWDSWDALGLLQQLGGLPVSSA